MKTLLFMLVLTVSAIGQEAHIKGSHLEHGALWQCHYTVQVADVTYLTLHNGNDHCEKALPTGNDFQVVELTKKKIKVLNSKNKSMTLDIVGTEE